MSGSFRNDKQGFCVGKVWSDFVVYNKDDIVYSGGKEGCKR